MGQRRTRLPGETYESEAALCAYFATRARAGGWKVYPECEGYDMLCVAGPDVKGDFTEGDQIGVEAKLRANVTVLYQLLEGKRRRGTRPHYFLALVPSCTGEFSEVARELGISVLTATRLRSFDKAVAPFMRHGMIRHLSDKTCWVPECEVEGMCGGRSAPERLTDWKIKAVKLCLFGIEQGHLTSADFLSHGVSITRWHKLGWIAPHDFVMNGKKRMRRYVLVDAKKPPHLKYPEVAIALAKAGEL